MKRIRIGCAVPDCLHYLVYENESGMLDIRLLTINGWRLDHGKWICGDHGVEPFSPGTLETFKDARDNLFGADLTNRHPEGF